MLDHEFMRLAFGAGAVVGVLAPAVGFFLVQRRMSLIGDGIGHVAFAGVALGYLIGIAPVITALVASIGGAIAVEWLRANKRTAGDQALALLFYTGIAAGVVIVSAAGALNANLFSFLFGSILTVTRGQLLLVAVLGGAGLLVIGLLYRALVAAGGALTGDLLETAASGEGPHPRGPALVGRCLRVLAELGLVSIDRSSATVKCTMTTAARVPLERSTAFSAYARRCEEGLRFLSDQTPRTRQQQAA